MSRKPKSSIERKEDSEEMKEAIRRIGATGLPLVRCSAHQLKSGHVNYWPASGRIFIDRMPKVQERGLEAFIEAAEKERAKTRGMPFAEVNI